MARGGDCKQRRKEMQWAKAFSGAFRLRATPRDRIIECFPFALSGVCTMSKEPSTARRKPARPPEDERTVADADIPENGAESDLAQTEAFGATSPDDDAAADFLLGGEEDATEVNADAAA